MTDLQLDESDLPFGAPRFDEITPDLVLPAFRAGIAEAQAELAAIGANRR